MSFLKIFLVLNCIFSVKVETKTDGANVNDNDNHKLYDEPLINFEP